MSLWLTWNFQLFQVDLFSWNKQNINFSMDLFWQIPRNDQNKKKTKKKNYYYSVFLFFLNMSKYISLLCVFFCHIHGYKESTFCNSFTVKEFLAQDRRDIWKLTDFNGTRTNNHLHRKRRINHLVQMGECSLTN